MVNIKSIVAKNLVMLRKNKGLTQADIAEKFNYSDKAVSRWEHGESLPDINVLYQICEFYGITLNDLVSKYCSVQDYEDYKKEKNARVYRIWLGILMCAIFWLCATIWFFYSLTILGNPYWVIFIWAVPFSSFTVARYGRAIFNWIVQLVLASVTIWSLITAFYLHALVAYGVNIWLIFIIGLPIEAVVFLWQRVLRYKNR